MNSYEQKAENELAETRREYLHAVTELKYIKAKARIDQMTPDELERRLDKTRPMTIPDDFDWLENIKKWTDKTVMSWSNRQAGKTARHEAAAEEAAKRMIIMARNYKKKGNVPSAMQIGDVRFHYTDKPEEVPDRLYSREYYKQKELIETLQIRLKEEQEKNYNLIRTLKHIRDYTRSVRRYLLKNKDRIPESPLDNIPIKLESIEDRIDQAIPAEEKENE